MLRCRLVLCWNIDTDVDVDIDIDIFTCWTLTFPFFFFNKKTEVQSTIRSGPVNFVRSERKNQILILVKSEGLAFYSYEIYNTEIDVQIRKFIHLIPLLPIGKIYPKIFSDRPIVASVITII